MTCREGCGACCVAPSITTPIPGMPAGKPAGVRCAQLSDDNRCMIFGREDRPPFCVSLRPSDEMCGSNAGEATMYLVTLESLTLPWQDPLRSTR